MLSASLVEACFRRDCWKCRNCKSRNNLHPHHVVFKSHGGEDELNNLITLCYCCHMDGVHRGNLQVEIIEVLKDDVRVTFIWKKGWKPQ